MSLESNYPLDAAIIMLGTNDCKKRFGANAHIIGKGLEICLDVLEKYVAPENILVVSPIELGAEVWRPEKDPEFDSFSVEISKGLKEEYQRVATKRGNQFLAASDFAAPSGVDDEHMDEGGHSKLAIAIAKKLKDMKVA